MIWGVIYVVLLAVITVIVLRIGERETRFAILTLAIGSALTLLSLLVSGSRFDIFSLLVMSVDLVVLAVFLGHALVSRRYWTLCLPAFQLITCFIHVVKLAAPEIAPRVYSAGQGFRAYPTMLIILMAAIWAKRDAAAQAGGAEQGSERTYR